MKNFIFKSSEADLHKMFTSLDTIQKNVLYLTHQVDFIRKRVVALDHDKDLQLQVDKYFEEGESAGIPDTRTSHQTELDEQ